MNRSHRHLGVALIAALALAACSSAPPQGAPAPPLPSEASQSSEGVVPGEPNDPDPIPAELPANFSTEGTSALIPVGEMVVGVSYPPGDGSDGFVYGLDPSTDTPIWAVPGIDLGDGEQVKTLASYPSLMISAGVTDDGTPVVVSGWVAETPAKGLKGGGYVTHLTGYDARDGSELWHGDQKVSEAGGGLSGSLVKTPPGRATSSYVQVNTSTRSGSWALGMIDVATGKSQLLKPAGTGLDWMGTDTGLTGTGASEGHRFEGVDLPDGEPRWVTPPLSFPSLEAISEGQFFLDTSGKMTCYDTATGRRLWSTTYANTYNVDEASLDPDTQTVVLYGDHTPSRNGAGGYNENSTLEYRAHDARTGKLLWHLTPDEGLGVAVEHVGMGRLYLSGAQDVVTILDIRTGDELGTTTPDQVPQIDVDATVSYTTDDTTRSPMQITAPSP